MTDFFAVFGLQRRPVIDGALLNDLFAEKSKITHPDRAVDGDFVGLNEAFRTLSDPVLRAEHLLALTSDEPPPLTAGAEVSQMFGPVATCLQRFDRMFQPISQVTSPLVRAVKIQELQPLVEELDELTRDLTREKDRLLNRLTEIDARWQANMPADRSSLAQVASDLRFVQKWLAQIAERRLRFEELI